MKHSFVALFSVLTCIVYGQLPGNWNPDVFGYRPYFALPSAPSTKQTNLFHFRPDAQGAIDEQPQTRNLVLAARMSLLELSFTKLAKELRTKLSDADEKIADLSSKLAQTTEVSSATATELDNLKQDYADFKTDTTDRISALEQASTCTCSADDTAGIGRIPGSCADLKEIGYTKSGLFSVMGSKQVETVYCDFTKEADDPDLQKLIGYEDVKSKPTYFYLQRTVKSEQKDVPIPFETEVVNSGDIDKTSGVFTAPVKGTYFFSFSGLAQIPETSAFDSYLAALLFRNEDVVARSQLNEVNAVANINYLSPVTVQATLALEQGDTVWMQIDFNNGAYLFDDNDFRATHFNGWLLEEEIAASLGLL
ncbi:uncharacterized protein LOC116927113 [Daphnia magna]|uniref:uncharacterized protein LOC116927113 n=1 Tax=Daphnia magna TaxID=35525 RepID=UPI001E1BB2AF|nr:uncharacterized protein LOC116927113 [Daphnia magna]